MASGDLSRLRGEATRATESIAMEEHENKSEPEVHTSKYVAGRDASGVKSHSRGGLEPLPAIEGHTEVLENSEKMTINLHIIFCKDIYVPSFEKHEVIAYIWKGLKRPEQKEDNLVHMVKMGVKRTSDNETTYYLEGKFNRDILGHDDVLCYKYCLLPTDKYSEKKFEYLHSKKPHGQDTLFRWLKLPNKSQGDIHYYDGIIRIERPSSAWPDHRRKDAEKALKLLIPPWTGFLPSGGNKMKAADALRILSDVVTNISIRRRVKLNKSGSKRSTEKDIKGIRISEILLDLVMTKCALYRATRNVHRERAEPTCAEKDRIDNMVSAIAMTLVIEQHCYKMIDHASLQILIWSLSIFSDSAEEQEKTVQAINQSYDDTQIRNRVKAAVISLCNFQIEDNNLQWLFCLPVIHILDGSYRSFNQPARLSSEEVIIKQPWWGLEGIHAEKQVSKLKQQHIKATSGKYC
ncbi:uncharacterized protein [Ptychodera flava]|uniref:uncharacterized protein n=1 Tax=Ptychodera flava TaxID=63121 RepID=UPI003969F6EA